MKTYKQVMQRFERAYLWEVLDTHSWNVTHAAASIGMHRVHLHEKIRRYKLAARRKPCRS